MLGEGEWAEETDNKAPEEGNDASAEIKLCGARETQHGIFISLVREPGTRGIHVRRVSCSTSTENARQVSRPSSFSPSFADTLSYWRMND